MKGELTLITGRPMTGKSILARALMAELKPAIVIDDARRGNLSKTRIERLLRSYRAVIVVSDDCWILRDLGFEHRHINTSCEKEIAAIFHHDSRLYAALSKIASRKPSVASAPAAFFLSRREAINAIQPIKGEEGHQRFQDELARTRQAYRAMLRHATKLERELETLRRAK